MMEVKVSENCIRVDLSTSPSGLVRGDCYGPGYGPEDSEDDTFYFEDGSIFQLCKALDDMGFVIHMDRDGQRARALRGKPTRIDILKIGQRWVVNKYPYGWTASTRPIESETKPAEFDVGQAVEWLQAHNWTVLSWDHPQAGQGYRAFKSKPEPVRDGAGIMAMRRRYPDTLYDLSLYF